MWNPPYVRRCYIKGMMPLVICGQNRASFNYAIHSDDCTKQGLAFGGGMSTVTFSLRVLYDEYTRKLNRWSYSNEQLDLARYRGCTFKVYRHTNCDFILSFDTVPPMKMNELTGPNTHPALLMLQKYKVLIPSFQTRPKGKKYKRIRILPPKMFDDKWYAQSDLCKVPLVSLRLTAASFQYPFCSPQTNNTNVTFQVLQPQYHKVIGFPILQNFNTTDICNFEKWLYGKCSHYQAFATEAHLRPRANTPTGEKITNDPTTGNNTWNSKQTQWTVLENNYKNWDNWWRYDFYATKADSNYGYCSFTPKDEKGITNIKTIRDNNFKYLTTWDSNNTNHINATYAAAQYKEYEYHCGWFSSMFLSPHRYSLQFSTAYFDCTYNPLNDHSQGNRIWFQYLTKPTTEFKANQCRYVLENLPLYAMCHGYVDYIQSQLGDIQDHETVGIICIQCPYTCPPMFDKENPDHGYVVYDSNFGMGKTPEGYTNIPRYWASRWRVYLGVQKQVLNDIDKSGPFAYRDEHNSVTLTTAYTFKFNWGGDMMFPQIIKNPCGTAAISSGSSRQPREVQIVDPLTMGPQWNFHPFDIRRGLYHSKAIKRVSEKPTADELYIHPPKRPYIFTEPEYQEQERGFNSWEEREPSSQEESEAEVQTDPVQKQLLVQLKQQKRLGEQLQQLWVQLAKTQSNTHLNPLLFSRA